MIFNVSFSHAEKLLIFITNTDIHHPDISNLLSFDSYKPREIKGLVDHSFVRHSIIR